MPLPYRMNVYFSQHKLGIEFRWDFCIKSAVLDHKLYIYIYLFPEVVNERNTANSHTLKFDIFSHLRHYVSLLLHTVQKYIMFWLCRLVTLVILLELWCLISSNHVSFILMVWLTLSDLHYLCMCVFMFRPVMLLILSHMFWCNIPFGIQNTEVWF
jgi:hypothetical protein